MTLKIVAKKLSDRHGSFLADRLLFFYETIRPSDLRVVERQMAERKFNSGLILGTANRCRFGCPRVIICSPLKGEAPFPTSFWLTCPWLSRLIGNVESHGGVSDLERWLEADKKQKKHKKNERFDVDHRLVRMALLPPSRLNFLRRFKPQIFDRLRRGGVGGIRHEPDGGGAGISPVRVKCIHLQVASWLALRRHPGEEWLKERGLGQDCSGEMKSFCHASFAERKRLDKP